MKCYWFIVYVAISSLAVGCRSSEEKVHDAQAARVYDVALMSKPSEYCETDDPRIYKIVKIVHDENLGLDRAIGETDTGNMLAEPIKAGTPLAIGMKVKYRVVCYNPWSGYQARTSIFVPAL